MHLIAYIDLCSISFSNCLCVVINHDYVPFNLFSDETEFLNFPVAVDVIQD